MFKQLISVFKPYATGLFPDPPTKPNYPQEVYQYKTQAWGSHQLWERKTSKQLWQLTQFRQRLNYQNGLFNIYPVMSHS